MGPRVETHPLFPRRTNVQFMRVVARDRIEFRIGERGVGYTRELGSGSCATVCAAHKLGLVGAHVSVLMPGGELQVEIGPPDRILLSGPVEGVSRGVLDADLRKDSDLSCRSRLGPRSERDPFGAERRAGRRPQSAGQWTRPFAGKIWPMTLDRPLVRAPEFEKAVWINTPAPVTLAGLRGRVVLIDIWDFTCINCLRTLPYLRAWHARYAAEGLSLVGVHTPEFTFAREQGQVEAAVRRLGIRWPVVLDNEQQIWTAFANRYWPSLYLIDADGYIRYQHVGEGAYDQTERAIQALLQAINPAMSAVEPVAHVRAEDAPGAVCYPTTPELHIDAAGNADPPLEVPLLFTPPRQRVDGRFYLQGTWQRARDGFTLAGERGAILLPYHAAAVNAVLSPTPDPVDLALNLKPPVDVALWQAGVPLLREEAGQDVVLVGDQAQLTVEFARMYNLARHRDVRPRELRLTANGPGLTLYAFSFESCVIPGGSAGSRSA